MLPGFNTNVRHRGVLFHVQSEDSGRAHPHIITHLYHGGTILFSEKSSYAELVDAPDLPARVRELMEAQHRAVLGAAARGRLRRAASASGSAPVLDDADARASTRPTATAPLEEPTEPPRGRRRRGRRRAERRASRRGARPSAKASSRRSRSTR